MKKCPYCGRDNADDIKICQYCYAGFPVEETKEPKKPEKDEKESEQVAMKRKRR